MPILTRFTGQELSCARLVGILLPESLVAQMGWYQKEKYNSRLEKWWQSFRFPDGIPEDNTHDLYLVEFLPKRHKAEWADYALGNHRSRIAYNRLMHHREKDLRRK